MFVKICKVSEIQDGELYRFDISEKSLLVTRMGERFFVTSSICTHEEADLSLGMFSEGVITCPLHRAKFEVQSGRVVEGPNGEDSGSIRKLGVFNTRIENGEIWVDI
ncbi:MAG: Rieske (2Fe-2S) protein [Rhabdochlamydiaceae bacterium]